MQNLTPEQENQLEKELSKSRKNCDCYDFYDLSEHFFWAGVKALQLTQESKPVKVAALLKQKGT